jgi:hypothetical protein
MGPDYEIQEFEYLESDIPRDISTAGEFETAVAPYT